MTSEKQIQANRINALKSGVKTEEGKAKVRLNAVTHGFFSKDDLLPGEDPFLLNELRERSMAEFQPQGEMETILVELIISSSWRLRRILKNERNHTNGVADYRYSSWQNILRYTTALQRQIYKAMHELQNLQKARLNVQPSPSPKTLSAAFYSTGDQT